ncbi:MAG: hypothetical protein AAB467_02570 [Patescibacteria group bacterium]
MKTRLMLLAAWLLPAAIALLGCGPLPGHNDSGLPDVPGLEAPTNLKVEALDAQVVRISWDEVSTLEVRTKIEVSFVSSTTGFAEVVVKERLTTDSKSPQTVAIDGLGPEKTAWFRAMNVLMRGRGASDYTGAVQVRMPAVNLVPPTNLVMTRLNDCNQYGCKHRLSWTKSASMGDNCYEFEWCEKIPGDSDFSCNTPGTYFTRYEKILEKTTSRDITLRNRGTIGKYRIRVGVCSRTDQYGKLIPDEQSADSEELTYTFP